MNQWVRMTTAAAKIAELADLLDYLGEGDRNEVNRILLANTPIWIPQEGPQTDARNSPADILYYGGQAGGGKTDLLLGLGLTQHQRTIIYRREGTQNLAMIDRLLNEILKDRKGWNGQDKVWRGDGGRQIEFGSTKDLGDEQKYQGRPHDLKCFDEITHFLEYQFRFLCGWLRSNKSDQRKRIICTGNPPTNEDGRWVVEYWAPWLKESHPNPAQNGELRWFTTIDGKDHECPDGTPFEYQGRKITPLSRTFIPSGVRDNVFMVASGYEDILAALPEPLRSQMLNGDFNAGVEDSQWQIFPTAWVQMAMDRWTPDGLDGEMTSCGADIARGGSAETVVSTRYGWWFDKLKCVPGAQTPDGASSAGVIISCLRDAAPVHVDVIGVGGSTVDHLNSNDVQAVSVNGAEGAPPGERDKATGTLKFKNMRAWLHWRFREMLDPRTGNSIALPPDAGLKADLCSIHWFLGTQGIQVESKEQIIHGPRLHKSASPLGHSPDKGDAVINCSITTVKKVTIKQILMNKEHNEYNPLTHGLGVN